MEGKIGTKIIRMVWLYSVVTSLDEMIMIIHDGIIENFNEEIKYIVGSISTVFLLGAAGFILKHLQNKISNKKVLLDQRILDIYSSYVPEYSVSLKAR